MRPRSIALAASVAALAAHSLGLASPARAATPVDVPFAYTGAEQSWVVPAGVDAIHVVLVAGQGGEAIEPTIGAAGRGAVVTGDLAVVAGDTLYVEVGGNGIPHTPTPAAFNGGGSGGGSDASGGGGASDLRTIDRGSAGTLASRLVVAGGGGGAGVEGSGGDAGSAGTGVCAGPGGGGTAAGGGDGGAGAGPGAWSSGGGGTAGIGGDGGFGDYESGGGGGGGYYGGGGGGGGGVDIANQTGCGSAGGGGGSSYTGSASNPTVGVDSSGIPSVTITYTPGADATPGPTPGPTSAPDNGTVNVQFSVPTSAACIELSTTSIDFGSVRLGAENVAATPDVIVTNCSGIAEDILARGSDATATGTTWSLVGGSATCADTLGLDSYRMALESTGGTVGLSTSNAPLGSLAGGDTSTQTARMWAACPGSSGSGQLMTSQITFLATEGS